MPRIFLASNSSIKYDATQACHWGKEYHIQRTNLGDNFNRAVGIPNAPVGVKQIIDSAMKRLAHIYKIYKNQANHEDMFLAIESGADFALGDWDISFVALEKFNPRIDAFEVYRGWSQPIAIPASIATYMEKKAKQGTPVTSTEAIEEMCAIKLAEKDPIAYYSKGHLTRRLILQRTIQSVIYSAGLV